MSTIATATAVHDARHFKRLITSIEIDGHNIAINTRLKTLEIHDKLPPKSTSLEFNIWRKGVVGSNDREAFCFVVFLTKDTQFLDHHLETSLLLL